MDTQSVADIYSELQDLTGADDNAAATLTLAYYIGKLTTFSGADMLAHGIALGVRKGLFGSSASDDESVNDNGFGRVSDAIRDAG